VANTSKPVLVEERDEENREDREEEMKTTGSATWGDHYRKIIDAAINGPRKGTLYAPHTSMVRAADLAEKGSRERARLKKESESRGIFPVRRRLLRPIM